MRRPTAGRQMEILIVEDEMVSARFTMEALRLSQFAHRATLVVNGEEAWEFLCQKGIFARAPRPDLILLDLFLPRLDGTDLLRRLRGDEQLCDIPVVVMTASTEPEHRETCQQLGVELYLTKPVDVGKFYAVLRELRHYLPAELQLPDF